MPGYCLATRLKQKVVTPLSRACLSVDEGVPEGLGRLLSSNIICDARYHLYFHSIKKTWECKNEVW
jgi:hypothetical protein